MNSIDTLHPSLENLCSKWGFRKLWHVRPHHKGTTGASKLIHLTIVLGKLPMNRLEFSMEAFGILQIRFKNSEGNKQDPWVLSQNRSRGYLCRATRAWATRKRFCVSTTSGFSCKALSKALIASEYASVFVWQTPSSWYAVAFVG